ncbi:unnamed protein product [Miscanthus lutarioriparius]|uniref:Uncharacterized protein n=1 Tax=Miscanthus lutarioriparius TaxID=422564 RepID=A0A811MGZ6_9POAL|nr:unnamed protein product [Miscanthus lutarioriparius]
MASRNRHLISFSRTPTRRRRVRVLLPGLRPVGDTAHGRGSRPCHQAPQGPGPLRRSCAGRRRRISVGASSRSKEAGGPATTTWSRRYIQPVGPCRQCSVPIDNAAPGAAHDDGVGSDAGSIGRTQLNGVDLSRCGIPDRREQV